MSFRRSDYANSVSDPLLQNHAEMWRKFGPEQSHQIANYPMCTLCCRTDWFSRSTLDLCLGTPVLDLVRLSVIPSVSIRGFPHSL
jgi:hypothetical protein